MRKFDLSLRSSRSSYFATFRHQLTILSKTDALDEEKWLNITEGVYCSRCVYYGKHQSFQATAGFRDYAPNAYSSSNGWSVFYQRSEERFSRNAETDLVCRLLLEKKNKHRSLRSRYHHLSRRQSGSDLR